MSRPPDTTVSARARTEREQDLDSLVSWAKGAAAAMGAPSLVEYARVQAFVHHFADGPRLRVLGLFGLDDARWSALQRHFCAKVEQASDKGEPEPVLQFATAFDTTERTLAGARPALADLERRCRERAAEGAVPSPQGTGESSGAASPATALPSSAPAESGVDWQRSPLEPMGARMPAVDETAELSLAVVAATLPFAGVSTAPPSALLADPVMMAAALGGTAALPDGAPEEPALPFREPQAEALPGWTLEHYASYCAELARRPQAREAIHARYGLADDARRQKLERSFEQRLEDSTALRAQWAKLVTIYADWLDRNR